MMTARAALSLTLALGACVQTVPQGTGQGAAARSPLRVTQAGLPFQMYDGAAARRVAEASCAEQGKRLRPSIYDRFDAGTWVYVEGCV